jgi:hypothetical protein
MSDPRAIQRKDLPATPAETARQEGAQGRTGKPASDSVGDGAIDASDPQTAADMSELADQVHANA